MNKKKMREKKEGKKNERKERNRERKVGEKRKKGTFSHRVCVTDLACNTFVDTETFTQSKG